MAENMIKFLRGNVADLPQTATAGALYFTKDEGVYLGLENGSYHRYGDFITVSDVASLPKAGAHQNCMYYCVAENILAKWDGSTWVQINKQKTLAELGGVAQSVYNTKMAALEKADSDNATAIDGVDTRLQAAEEKLKSVATTQGLGELTNRVSTAEGEIDDLQAAIADGGSVANAIAAAKKAGDDAADAVNALEAGQVKTNKEAIEAINNETTGILAQAKSYADGKDTAIAAAKTAADAAQADVDALEAKVGTVPEGKTVVQMISDAQTAATYDDTALKNRVSTIEGDYLKAADKTELQGNIDTVSGKVTTLIGSVEGDDGKSARTIASEEVAKIVAGADASYDTLKEISDWISSHKNDASAMNSAITALEGIVDGIGGAGEKATVVAYVTDAIAALNIDDYAKAADLTALASRVTTAEGKITTLEGQVATINGDATTAGSIAKAAADALASAKAYTDEKDTAMDTRVDALEAASHTHRNKALLDTYTQTEENLADAVSKKHEHTNKTVLDGITAEKVSAWNSAESNAKSYTDELANGQVTTNKTNIESLQSGKANKATTLAGYGIGDAYTKDEVQELLTWGEF